MTGETGRDLILLTAAEVRRLFLGTAESRSAGLPAVVTTN